MPPNENGESDVGELGPPEYLIYRVLVEMDKRDDRETSRTRIHKLCCLTDRLLHEKSSRDVGLPVYWYKYGRIVQEPAVNTAVIYGPQANRFKGRAYYPADQVSESDFDHLSKELKQDVSQAVEETVDEYGHLNAEELEEVQYQNYAPDGFVKAYADLRWYLALISHDESQTTFSRFASRQEKTRIEEHLDEMLVSFDEEKYGDVHDLYLKWDDTIRLLNKTGSSPKDLLEFTEMFVEAVAKIVLRLNVNWNIPSEKLEEWREEKGDVVEDLNKRIERERESALSNRTSETSLDDIAEAYNKSITEELDEL